MAQVTTAEFQAAYPRKHPDIPFRAIDGFIDFLLPSVAVGSSGAISGLPNIAPVCFFCLVVFISLCLLFV